MSDATTTISFIQNHVPALESGQYRIETEQTVTTSGTVQATYTAAQHFYVTGKRYRLEAGDVNSVFPPVGSAGQFASTLPHVVLNASSLPWQRSTGYSHPLTNGNKAPWMALLLFDETEAIGAPQQVTLDDLVTNNQVFFPPHDGEPGEEGSQPVNVIDVPLNLFNAIVPAVVDLQWLAHVRKVAVTDKVTVNDEPSNDTYAFVIGNRLPNVANTSTMHLVSLENYSDYLPDESGNGSAHIPVGITTMRLVSLHSWSFRTEPQLQSLSGLLATLDMAPATLQLPFTADADSGSEANDAVQNAFGMGYTALNHQLRDGDRTVSWYRGPLLPLGLPSFVAPPYSNPDQLMRFDPDTAMFDASYAAAWQLGKLLALRDNGYAQTLVRWKARQVQDTAQALEEAVIDGHLGGTQNARLVTLPKKQARMAAAIKSIIGPAAKQLKSPRTS